MKKENKVQSTEKTQKAQKAGKAVKVSKKASVTKSDTPKTKKTRKTSEDKKENKPKKVRGTKKVVAESHMSVPNAAEFPEIEQKEPEVVASVSDQEKAEYQQVCLSLAEAKEERDRLLKEVKTLKMLLASFNAINDDINEVVPVKPALGTSYWFIRAQPTGKHFALESRQWHDNTSDHYRYANGNMFLDITTANLACVAMNKFLKKL